MVNKQQEIQFENCTYDLFFPLVEWIYTGLSADYLKENLSKIPSLLQLSHELGLNSLCKQLTRFTNDPDHTTNSDLLCKPDPLINLINSAEYSDIKIRVGGKILNAHRIILYTRSPHFRQMFDCGMIESTQKEINIPDERSQTFLALLNYIYSTNYTPNEDTVVDLLSLANAYNMPHLLQICEKYLEGEMNEENVVEFLSFSALHNATQLFHYCITYVAKNWKKMQRLVPSTIGKDIKDRLRNLLLFLEYPHKETILLD